ncbi:GerMN domain-containing protein [Arthrobacter monumenti]
MTAPQAGAAIPLTVYYIALNDGGATGEEVGCGDSLVAAFTEPVAFKDQLKATMDRLLADDNMHHGGSGLYNALYKSDLTFTSGNVSDGTVTVNLKGTIRQSGVCDAPRIEAQLSQAAETAAGADSSDITLNGKPLPEVLSSR